MGRNSIFSRSLSGLLAIACLLAAVPSFPAAAGITPGNPVPEILYSDSGAVVENPITDTDLDNFLISLKYGVTEEDFGDTLFLRDACVSIPVTVSIEYTGEGSYHAGDLSFTLQDIEGLTRRNKDGLPEADAVTTEISAQRYGSETGTGDWCYYSEEMENHSGSYQFLNQFEVNGHFSSSMAIAECQNSGVSAPPGKAKDRLLSGLRSSRICKLFPGSAASVSHQFRHHRHRLCASCSQSTPS